MANGCRLEKPLIREMYASGLSTRQIAHMTGGAKSRIALICSDIARSKSAAAQLRQPPTSTKPRALNSQARKLYQRVHGVKLASDIHVHHRDSNLLNGDISNLQAIDASSHSKHHHPVRPENLDVDGNMIPKWKRPAVIEYMKKYLPDYQRAYRKKKRDA